jgi:hypothetical protein
LDPIPKLIERLAYVNATRVERQSMASEILRDANTLKPLLEIAMERNDEIGQRACWVVEFVCKADLSRLYPHLNYFTQHLKMLRNESSIRPMAKVCELLATAHIAEGPQPTLSDKQCERMIAAAFDWLIGPHKVAAKAYSMNTLFLLGQEVPWVHGDLKATIQQHYPTGSPAYKARARQVLKLLKKSV